MTPLRLRLFALSFLAIVTGISANALYLQDPPQFAGTAISETTPTQSIDPSTASLPRSTAKIYGRDPDDGGASVSKQAEKKINLESSPTTRSTGKIVRAIQRELTRKGYNPGGTDGNASIETRAAIIAYEFDEGLPLKGEPSENILRSLIFGAASGTADLGQTDRFERRRDLVMQVQDTLAQLGYITGPSSGQFDSATRDAIRKFENDRELSGNGRLTARVLLELVIAGGGPFKEVS
jgi:peptidoglycan hydrolase-like protein with peptidoglycan-binding domain